MARRSRYAAHDVKSGNNRSKRRLSIPPPAARVNSVAPPMMVRQSQTRTWGVRRETRHAPRVTTRREPVS
jgi:hypothetical protein